MKTTALKDLRSKEKHKPLLYRAYCCTCNKQLEECATMKILNLWIVFRLTLIGSICIW